MTSTDIANLALAKVAEGSEISSINDTGSARARLCKLHYDQVLVEAAREHFWTFSTRVKKLTEDGFVVVDAEEKFAWEYAYPLPDDFQKLEKLWTGDYEWVDKFELRTVTATIYGGQFQDVTALLTDHLDPYLRYTETPSDPNRWDSMFTAAVVTLLASRIARQITGSDQLEQQLLARYEQVDLPRARSADGHDSRSNENHPLQELLRGDLTGGRGDFSRPEVIAELP